MISDILKKQREFFSTGQTLSIEFRKNAIIRLKALIKDHEQYFYEAISMDFKKSEFETYETEISQLYFEINLTINNLKKWSKTRKIKTNVANFPGRSFRFQSPYGNVLIIGTWNYPFLLTLQPLISAIAAGNTAIVKPSEHAPNSSSAVAKLINHHFPNDFIFVYEADKEASDKLLDFKFDKIFFTGSKKVGQIVLEKAAKHLCPVTLELGGKSPCIVLPDTNIQMAAKRIVWGKFLNAGQTCIAPDYVLIHKSEKDRFIKLMIEEIKKNYEEDPSQSTAFTRIINQPNFNRLINLIPKDKVICGGNSDKNSLYISPTLLHNISFEDKIMQDEIFGPVLPIIEFDDFEQMLEKLHEQEHPLAFYLFTSNKKIQKRIMQEFPFGGATINDTLMHFSNPNLPFGGIGSSGMGNYHGKAGFDNFSHFKYVLRKSTWFEPFMRYPPYNEKKKKWIKFFME